MTARVDLDELNSLAVEMERQHDDARAPWIGPNDVQNIFAAITELRDLRERMEGAPVGVVSNRHSNGAPNVCVPVGEWDVDLWGKKVRLVVCDDQ